MELNDFVKLFADQFDDTDLSEFTPSTVYKDLDEWSSLTQLAVYNMIKLKFAVPIKYLELKECRTIEDLYKLIISKQ